VLPCSQGSTLAKWDNASAYFGFHFLFHVGVSCMIYNVFLAKSDMKIDGILIVKSDVDSRSPSICIAKAEVDFLSIYK
jgi:hypothetical protein